jgi:hypothetical protein
MFQNSRYLPFIVFIALIFGGCWSHKTPDEDLKEGAATSISPQETMHMALMKNDWVGKARLRLARDEKHFVDANASFELTLNEKDGRLAFQWCEMVDKKMECFHHQMTMFISYTIDDDRLVGVDDEGKEEVFYLRKEDEGALKLVRSLKDLQESAQTQQFTLESPEEVVLQSVE